MSETLGYGVYSEFEEGYLVIESPSTYLWDPAAAFLYDSPAKARASAKRRGLGYAVAVSIVRYEDGSIGHEELPVPMKAAPGSWIVSIIDNDVLPNAPLYVTTLGRDGKIKASTELHEARGFSYEQAVGLLDRFKDRLDCHANVEQVQAEAE